MWDDFYDPGPVIRRPLARSMYDYEINLTNAVHDKINAGEEEYNSDSSNSDGEKDIDLTVSICDLCGKKVKGKLDRHATEVGHMSLISPGLYVGAAWNAGNATEMRAAKIDTIVCMASELGSKKFAATITYRNYSLEDDCREFILPVLIDSATFISQERARSRILLVHCAAGRSRSVAAVMTFLISQGATVEEALRTCQRARPIAQPNSGYMEQLHALEILFRTFPLSIVTVISAYVPQNGWNL